MAAEAAEAAEEAPRALITAAPRCCTCGMKFSSIHLCSTSDWPACRRLGVRQIRVLRRGVIAPDGHAADVGDVRAGLVRELREGAVVIEARHGGEVARLQVLRVGARDQRVGVGRVADHQHFHLAVRDLVERLALRREDLRVRQQQILALHARAARPRADQASRPGSRGRRPCASSLATTLPSVGNAQSSSSITTPFRAASAGVTSSRCRLTRRLGAQSSCLRRPGRRAHSRSGRRRR